MAGSREHPTERRIRRTPDTILIPTSTPSTSRLTCMRLVGKRKAVAAHNASTYLPIVARSNTRDQTDLLRLVQEAEGEYGLFVSRHFAVSFNFIRCSDWLDGVFRNAMGNADLRGRPVMGKTGVLVYP